MASLTKSLWKEFDKKKAPDDAPPDERDPSGKYKECGRILKMTNSSTGALKSHLKCHKRILARVIASELAETEQDDANSLELHQALVDVDEYKKNCDDFINSPSNNTPLKTHKQKKLLPAQSTPNNSIVGYFQPKVSIFDKR
ncbi:uncharacterized protein LOC136091335 [Hydra vulgaris]|uniref:Uncharacterized protein LOC136091335 n=1 Tax=Hydra vulgaris TaxID=6087 RepID=A0ABM4DJX6_HYDVU